MSKTGKEYLTNAVAKSNIDMGGFQLRNLDATNLSVSLPSQGTHSGEFLTTNGSATSWTALPAALSLQVANSVLSGPTTGANAAPTFRALVAADVPSLAASKITSGSVAANVGGTGQSSYAVGDLLYASGSTALSKLTGVAAGSMLMSRGVTTAPTWSTLSFVTDAVTVGSLLVGGVSNTIGGILANVATGNALLTGGSNVAPFYGKVTSAHADSSLLKASSNLSDVGTQATAQNNLLPSQASASGKYLTSNGTNVSWATVAGSGSFTSFAFTNGGGFVGTVANGTTSPTLSLTLGDSGDSTKTATLDCSNIATSTNRVINVPNANSTTAQANTGASHNFLTAMSAQGVFSRAQPAVADISDFNASIAPAFTVLTDGATVTLTAVATTAIQNRTLTIGGNRTLAFSGVVNGMSGVIVVTQDGTGGRTLVLPATSKVINNGSGAITLTAAAGGIDILGWIQTSSAILWTILSNFS